mgnify:CR=1 FL=1
MIYCLTGKLLEKAPDYAVVSCGGVGYLAAIPSTTAGALPAVGDTCTTVYLYEWSPRMMCRCLALPTKRARRCSAF